MGTRKKTSESGETARVSADAVAGALGSEADYLRFLSEAKAIPADRVARFRADTAVAYFNAKAAVEILAPEKARIASDLPKESWAALSDTPNLVLALAFAARAAELGTTAPSVQPLLEEGRRLRSVMLTSAEAAAKAGILDVKTVADIKKGKGARDAAEDCVALAALFNLHKHALRGKTPVTAAEVSRASVVGTELLTLLKPASVKKSYAAKGEAKARANVRDRMWTLLVARYERIERVSAYLFGPQKGVPALQARVLKRKKKETPPVPKAA